VFYQTASVVNCQKNFIAKLLYTVKLRDKGCATFARNEDMHAEEEVDAQKVR